MQNNSSSLQRIRVSNEEITKSRLLTCVGLNKKQPQPTPVYSPTHAQTGTNSAQQNHYLVLKIPKAYNT